MTILRIFRAVALFFSSQKHLKLWIKISFSTFSTDVVKMSSKAGADFVCTSPATDCKNRKNEYCSLCKAPPCPNYNKTLMYTNENQI